jgi:methylated-DNA-[protein]-cysteine S-methyltransferase
MVCFAFFETAAGPCGIVAREDRLVASYLPGLGRRLARKLRTDWPDATEAPGLFAKLQAAIRAYFAGRQVSFNVKLDLSDYTPFQEAVLRACHRIPYGKTASYIDLARAAGRGNAARSVGSTMARNPMPLIIPCHRVIRADGSIGGFSSPSGVKEKLRMLALEGVTLDETGRFSLGTHAQSERRATVAV